MTERTELKPARKSASRPARAAAIAAVAAASLVSGNASADAAANMNLGYEFLDEIRRASPVEQESQDTEAPVSAPASRPSASGWHRSSSAPDTLAPASAEGRIDLGEQLAEAERLYRSGRFNDALPAFRAITEADAGHAQAWLRVGNLLHRKRDWFDALTAYRRAARPQADPAIREKALYNVALLNLELARQALKRLERIRADENMGPGTGGVEREPGVSDSAISKLSNQLSLSYDELAATRREGGQPERESLPVISAAASSAAPSPGPRAAKPIPAEKPVDVEIRQGGGVR